MIKSKLSLKQWFGRLLILALTMGVSIVVALPGNAQTQNVDVLLSANLCGLNAENHTAIGCSTLFSCPILRDTTNDAESATAISTQNNQTVTNANSCNTQNTQQSVRDQCSTQGTSTSCNESSGSQGQPSVTCTPIPTPHPLFKYEDEYQKYLAYVKVHGGGVIMEPIEYQRWVESGIPRPWLDETQTNDQCTTYSNPRFDKYLEDKAAGTAEPTGIIPEPVDIGAINKGKNISQCPDSTGH